MSTIACVGVDDGYAEIKIFTPDGRAFALPSRAMAGTLNRIAINGSEVKIFAYSAPEGRFVAGDIDRADPTNYDGYPVSAHNRVLVMHALLRAGFGGQAVSICTGLPVKTFYRGTRINKEAVKAKRNNLLINNVVADNQEAMPIIVGHQVISEAIAAWVDYVVQPEKGGKLVVSGELAKRRVAVIDIGGRTTDTAVIRDWELDISRSSTIEAGMLNVYEGIREGVRDEFGVEVDDQQIIEAAKTNTVTLWGKPRDVASVVAMAKEVAINHIRSEVMRRLGKGADIDVVLFVGGGVLSFGHLIQGWFPHQVIGDNPAFCNARGMQKFTQLAVEQEAASRR